MKTANEDMFSCSEFKEAVHDYIDDEIHPSNRKSFIAHAEICPECKKFLADLLTIRKRMTVMPQKTVSDSFNAKLGALLQAESAGFTVSHGDRMAERPSRFRMQIIIPAAAAILCAALILPMSQGLIGNRMKTAENSVETQSAQSTDSGSVLSDAEINYVMDSINRDKADIGVFLNEGAGASSEDNSETVMLVSY